MTTDLTTEPPWSPPRPGTGMSPNLRLNEIVTDRRRHGLDTLHLGFGEARLPLVPELEEVLAGAAGDTAYAPVAGTPAAREAVAGYFRRRRLPTRPAQVVLAPGSKPLLFAVFTALDGDVYLPAPCWNSYAPQVALSGRTPVPVPIGGSYGGLPDPGLLERRIGEDLRRGIRPAAIVVNSPDNPTGTSVPREAMRELCRVARNAGLTLVSDEIYRDLHHEGGDGFVSPAELAPERTVVCTGLSKSLAIGGWRIGGARFPAGAFGAGLRDRTLAVASEVWSALAAPMQAVAAYAFGEPPAITERLRRSAHMHGSVSRACHTICRSHGAAARRPTAGFYVYADFEARRRDLARHGAVDSASLAQRLLDRFGIAVLGGHHLGDDPRRLAFKMATTGFVGETPEEQSAALDAAEAAELPHVRRRLRWLDSALATLTAPPTDWTR
ncbi:pyridoxal phosphate-dependent aminotransferase [Spirillospora sp. CA-253888]